MKNLLIKNAIPISKRNVSFSDILIENGIITKIDKNLELPATNGKIINAKDYLVIPGGIDPHVHLNLPTYTGYSSDDFYSGSKAALYGGTTTLIDFVTPTRGQSIIEALKLRIKEADGCCTDYKFHVSPVEWTSKTKDEIFECVKNYGVKSFKLYMAYKNNIGLEDEDILKVMKAVAQAGGLVTIHAEMGDEIENLRNTYANQGNLSPEYHAKSRPANTEADAVKKVIEMAKQTNCPVYIVHVSSRLSLDYIKKAQDSGQVVYTETCMHYLLLNKEKYIGSFEQTSPYVLSPPLRNKEDQEGLWQAIKEGIIQTIGTDHCPFNMRQKKVGLEDFRKIPNGAGSVEHRIKLLYTYGVLTEKINHKQFTNLIAGNVAEIFNLLPQKGRINIDYEADIVIWNKNTEKQISTKSHIMNCDNDIFENIKTIGAPEYVIKDGEIIFYNSDISTFKPPKGRFLK